MNDRPKKKGRTFLLNDDDGLDRQGLDGRSLLLTGEQVHEGISFMSEDRQSCEKIVMIPSTDEDFDDLSPLRPLNKPKKGKKGASRKSSLPGMAARARKMGTPAESLEPKLQCHPSSRFHRSLSLQEKNRKEINSDLSSIKSGTSFLPPGTAKTAHVDLIISFGDIKMVCSTKHYDLAQLFAANVTRLRNGRPDKTILSFLDENGPQIKRSVFVDVKPNENSVGMPTEATKLQLSLQLPQQQSEKRNVVRKWWLYAYGNVIVEIRQRRKERETFLEKDTQFDWQLQSYRRKQYIDLYIANRLEKSAYVHSMEIKTLPSVKKSEEMLLSIEDDLPIEQLLLYRAIARALRVRGMSNMPASVKDVRLGEMARPIKKKTVQRRKRPTHASRDERNVAAGIYSTDESTGTEVALSFANLRRMCETLRGGRVPNIWLGETCNTFRQT